MNKLVAFSLVTLLFLSGCGNQPTVPADPPLAPSRVTNSTAEPSDTPYIPKETIVETELEVPAKEPPAAPESEPTEMETVPVSQAEISINIPQESQYEVVTVSPVTDTEESAISPVQEETPQQTQTEPPEPQSEPEPPMPQPVPPEVSSEPEIQEPTESIDDCIAYGQDYAISIGLALDHTAVDCWDTPITSSDPYYIKRDIVSRLNRYKNHEDVTDVWIWKESVGNGRYEIYIGYA